MAELADSLALLGLSMASAWSGPPDTVTVHLISSAAWDHQFCFVQFS